MNTEHTDLLEILCEDESDLFPISCEDYFSDVVPEDDSFDDWLCSMEDSCNGFSRETKGVNFMSFLKSAWFTVCINMLDALIHYLDRKGVIQLESHSTEE